MLALLLFGQNIVQKDIDRTKESALDALVATYHFGDVKFNVSPPLKLFDILDAGHILNFTSFDGQYSHGGIMPEGGIEVFIRFRDTEVAKSIPNIIGEKSRFSKITSRSEINVQGQRAIRAVYENDYVVFREVVTAVYFERNNKIYEFSATVYRGDRKRKELTNVFEKLVQSISFVD